MADPTGSLNDWREQKAKEHRDMLEQKAKDLGVPGNLALAEYVIGLENRISYIEGFLAI